MVQQVNSFCYTEKVWKSSKSLLRTCASIAICNAISSRILVWVKKNPNCTSMDNIYWISLISQDIPRQEQNKRTHQACWKNMVIKGKTRCYGSNWLHFHQNHFNILSKIPCPNNIDCHAMIIIRSHFDSSWRPTELTLAHSWSLIRNASLDISFGYSEENFSPYNLFNKVNVNDQTRWTSHL